MYRYEVRAPAETNVGVGYHHHTTRTEGALPRTPDFDQSITHEAPSKGARWGVVRVYVLQYVHLRPTQWRLIIRSTTAHHLRQGTV